MLFAWVNTLKKPFLTSLKNDNALHNNPFLISGLFVDSSSSPVSLSSLRPVKGRRILAVYAAVESPLKYWGAKPGV